MKPEPNIRPDRMHGVFWVASSTNPQQEHMVDITEERPLGACGCTRYVCYTLPHYTKTGEIKRCRHLEAVKEYLFRRFQDYEETK